MFFLKNFKFYNNKVSKMLKMCDFCYLQAVYNDIKGGIYYDF